MSAIRLATAGDVDRIVELRLEFLRDVHDDPERFPAAGSIAEYLHRAIPSGECVVWLGECEGEIVATGAMTIYERMMWEGVGREGYVLSMYTVPAHRGKGIATAIVEAMLQHARIEGLKLALIATDEGRPIYERAGFEPDARYLRWR